MVGGQVLKRHVKVERQREGEKKGGELVVDGVTEQRLFTVGELELLAGQTGFQPLAWYGDLDADATLDDDDAPSLVVVLQKVP
jgi:hypothetical protein